MNINEIAASIKEMRKTAPDNIAVKNKELYPALPIGGAVTQEMIDDGNNRFLWDGQLYKVPQPITQILDNWTPDLAPALYEAIDEQHAGTAEDPIPYVRNMKVYEGKLYIYNGILYRCTRNSGNQLQYTPEELLGQYFKKAETVENTKEEQI